jgi:hypothetical protein
MRFLRVLLVMLTVSVSLLAADSTFSGTWKFNPAKGHPLPPLPKSIVAQVEADEQNFKFSEEFVDDKDQTSKLSHDAKIDGKDYPVTGDPDCTAIDGFTVFRVPPGTDEKVGNGKHLLLELRTLLSEELLR